MYLRVQSFPFRYIIAEPLASQVALIFPPCYNRKVMPRRVENSGVGLPCSQDVELGSGSSTWADYSVEPDLDPARPRSDANYHTRSQRCTVHVRDDVVVDDEGADQDCGVEKNGGYACFASLPTQESAGTVSSKGLLRECLQVILYRLRVL